MAMSKNVGASVTKNDQALAMLNEQRLTEAKFLYENICQNDPLDAESWFMLGIVHAQLKAFDKAETCFMRSAAVAPERAAIHYNLGKARESQEKFDLALQSYQEALRIEPRFAAAYNNIGTLYQYRGMDSEAATSFREALRLDPSLFEAHFNLGNIYRHQGKLDEAMASYKHALNLKQDSSDVRRNIGHVLYRLGRLEEAADSYRLALQSKPDDAQANNGLGNALRDIGKLEEANASFRKALQIKPDFAEALNNMGVSLKLQGKYEEAIAVYTQALKIRPEYAQAYNNLGNALRDIGKLEEAKARFRKALQIKPEAANVYFNLHSLLIDRNDMAPVINCLTNAIMLNPKNIGYKFHLGTLLEYAGNSKTAAHYLKEAQQGSALDKACLDSWNYIKSAQQVLPTMIGSTTEGLRLGMDAAPASGLVMEFGVRHGATIRQIAELASQQVHGFDSFEGLPEVWHDQPKGSYTANGIIPKVPDNVRIYKGWFENTLPAFVKAHKQPVRFMNIDCDLYSSTKTILDSFSSQIIPGTVIAFDEYFGNVHWRKDEFKAFQEAVHTYGWHYEYLAFSLFTKQAVVRILQVTGKGRRKKRDDGS